MALRARVREFADGVVPAELLSKADPVWQSEAATRRWLHVHGLSWRDRMAAGPLNRHEWAAHEWALGYGFTMTWASGIKTPDHRRMREAGVPSWGGAEVSEWLTHLGMEGRR